MSEARIIKKYPNRRLYDTAISSYITLEDVKRLVLDHVEFRVVDARTQEDLTRGILLQIINEQEERGAPMLSTELLEQLIRFYGDTLQGMMGSYLEKSMDLFVEQQNVFREQMQSLMQRSPLGVMTDMAERNIALWKTMQKNLFVPAGGKPSDVQVKDKATSEGHPQATDKGTES
jgi:polyhydroxyalkanoate synthesis repressor PhaR